MVAPIPDTRLEIGPIVVKPGVVFSMCIGLISPNGPWVLSRWASLVPQTQLTHNLLIYEFYFIFKKGIINVFNLNEKYLIYLVYI